MLENMPHTQEKTQSIETDPEMTVIIKWADKNLKAALVNMIKCLMELYIIHIFKKHKISLIK